MANVISFCEFFAKIAYFYFEKPKIIMKPTLRNVFLTSLALTLVANASTAKEGMWLPPKIQEQEAEMKKMGLQMQVADLYNENGTGLNNAVVIFGGGCTGEFVSERGLIFTNHHCAYSAAQGLSTPENNFLEQGFFAQNKEQEIPCPGLTVQVVKKIENVTKYILKNVHDSLSEEERGKIIKQRSTELEKSYQKLYGAEIKISAYYEGNEYWIATKETYSDVRLVAFPPNGIGKFGADTDNWMWPRQTGDFAVLRVYAGKDNKPANYSPDNVPFKPVRFFPINVAGIQEGDFTMVYGYPGRTMQYLSSYQVDQVQNILDPIRIKARTEKLEIWDKHMRQDKTTFLKYASKQSSVANGWKKWQGEVMGLSQNNVIGKKQAIESTFEKQVGQAGTEQERLMLTNLQANTKGNNSLVEILEYNRETVLAIEAIQQAATLQQVLNVYRSELSGVAVADSLQKIKNRLKGFYKNYLPEVDKDVFVGLMPMYLAQGAPVVPASMNKLAYNNGNKASVWAGNVYSNSLVPNETAMYTFLDKAAKADSTVILNDPAYQIYDAVMTYQKNDVGPKLKANQEKLNPLFREYVKAQMKYNPSKKQLYPDANSTLRIAYGNVTPIAQAEGNFFVTTLDDLVPRHNPAVEEFNIPAKLLDLHQNKDFGRWAKNGTVPVNFIATNHTTGGNSGSPVLNAKGQLIGINFDRIWQGTMSDIYFDESFCRNVAVDVRYVLFILEKYGNASWLFKEMKIVDK